jgi:hypothetical protein
LTTSKSNVYKGTDKIVKQANKNDFKDEKVKEYLMNIIYEQHMLLFIQFYYEFGSPILMKDWSLNEDIVIKNGIICDFSCNRRLLKVLGSPSIAEKSEEEK